jgi:hypothetical protein
MEAMEVLVLEVLVQNEQVVELQGVVQCWCFMEEL